MNIQIPRPAAPSLWVKLLAIFALIFGVMTVFSGGSVLFGPAEAQVWAGNYFRFVVWFNFGAGFAYIAAAIGLWMGTNWAVRLPAFIALATAVGALALRVSFWAVVALTAKRAMRPT